MLISYTYKITLQLMYMKCLLKNWNIVFKMESVACAHLLVLLD
jgi:hypothetical protein